MRLPEARVVVDRHQLLTGVILVDVENGRNPVDPVLPSVRHRRHVDGEARTKRRVKQRRSDVLLRCKQQ